MQGLHLAYMHSLKACYKFPLGLQAINLEENPCLLLGSQYLQWEVCLRLCWQYIRTNHCKGDTRKRRSRLCSNCFSGRFHKGRSARPGIYDHGDNDWCGFYYFLVIGPALASQLGFESLFFILGFLGLMAIIVTIFLFPKLKIEQTESKRLAFIKKLKNIEIQKLFLSTFIISFILNLFLFIYPLSWKDLNFDLSNSDCLSDNPGTKRTICVSLCQIFREESKTEATINLGYFFLIIGVVIYIFKSNNAIALYIAGGAFFLGHSLFQSLLPYIFNPKNFIGKQGSIFRFFQPANFFGASMGGMLAGKLYETQNTLPLLLCLMLLLVWIWKGLPNPPLEDKD